MRLLRALQISATAVAVLLCPFASAQTTLIEAELGYQWLDVSGSEDMYRTQVNQDDGFVLSDLRVVTLNPGTEPGVLDRLRIDAAGFGGSANGRFRLRAGLADAYSLSLTYRQMEHYSALPGLANPLLADGVTPGFHTWSRDRDLLDLQIELVPGGAITPILGYRWNRYEGPRRTTYHVGADEFALASDLEETEEELWAGIAFTFGSFRGMVTQGWRDFEADEQLRLEPGAGSGIVPNEVLGEDVTLDDLNQQHHSEADTPVTTAHIAGQLSNRVLLRATYARADYESETQFSEMLSGSLVSFELSRFFAGLERSVRSRTSNPSWRGDVEMDVQVTDSLLVQGSYERHHRELDGWATIASLYLDTLNFSGAEPRDIERLLDIENAMDRDEDAVRLRANLTNLGFLRLWAEGVWLQQELDIDPDAAQIIVPGGQEGLFERDITEVNAGAGIVVSDVKVLLDVSTADADDQVVRTDFSRRSRLRLRLDAPIGDRVDALVTAETISSSGNDTGYDSTVDHLALDLTVRPTEGLSLRAAWDRYQTESSIVIREPQSYSLTPTMHSEDGTMLEAALRWRVDKLHLGAGYSDFENEGTFPFEMQRSHVRVGYDLSDQIGLAIELERAEYSEDRLILADYDADRYGVFLRWRR
jgi:hypothetical protein